MALLALVAVAAAGHAPSAGASRPERAGSDLLQDYIATLALLIMPVGVLLILWAMLMKRVYRDVPLKSKEIPLHGVPRPFIQVAIIIALIGIALRYGPFFDNGRPGLRGVGSGGKERRRRPPPTDQYEPQFQWLPMFVVGSLVVGIGGAMVLMSVRRQRELLAATPIRETLDEVLAETLDDLRREPDPRKAVIGAYSNMERTLAARGVPSHESEAPDEYLARILDVVGASGHSVRRLTGSSHGRATARTRSTLQMKEDAIDALTGLRAELAAR